MIEYIKRNDILNKFIEGDGDDEFTEGYNFAVNEHKDIIKAIPPADVQPRERVKICCQLYDTDGCACGAFYNDCETIEDLVQFLDDISDNGYYSYEIGIDDLTRRK